MHKQLKQIPVWLSRKKILLFVLIFTIALPGISIFLFTQKSNLSYLALSVFVLPCLGILFFLLKTIDKIQKVSDELRVRKENYRITLNSLAEGLISTDKEGNIVYMNPAAERLTNWSWQDAKNQPLHKVYNIINEETGKPIENIVNRILKDRKKIEWENNTILKSKNSDNYIISNHGSPVLDINGNISGAVLLFNDITEKDKIKKALEANVKQYRNLIQNLPEAVYTCSAEGYIQLYNNAAVKLWGRQPVAGKDLWCGFWKTFNTDGTYLPTENCPMAICLKEGMPVHGKEIMAQRPDQSYRHILPYPSPLFNAEGQLTGAINMLIDVTDKKEREILIKKTEEKYHTLVEQASDAILIYSFDGTIHDFNKSCYTMLGYTAEEYAKLRLTDILVDEIIVNQDNYTAILAGETKTLYRHLKRKDGSLIETEVTVKMMADGKAIAFARDVTERKRAEEEIRKNEKRFRALIENNNTIIALADENFKPFYRSPSAVRITGWTDDELAGRGLQNLMHPDDINLVKKTWADVIANPGKLQSLSIRSLHKNGSYISMEGTVINLLNDENVKAIVTNMMDVTERKNAEEELRSSEETKKLIMDSALDAIISMNTAGIITAWTPQAENIFGWKAEEVIGKTVAETIIPVKLRERHYMGMQQYLKTGEGRVMNKLIEISALNREGNEFPVEMVIAPINQRGIQYFCAFIRDITQRKNAETKTKAAIERYDILARATSDTIWDWDIVNNTMLYNDGITEMFGYNISAVENMVDWWKDKLHSEDFKKVQDSLANVFENGLQRFQLTYRFRCADGSYKHIFDRAFVLFGENGKPTRVIGAMQDVTYQTLEEIRISKAIMDAQEEERRYIGEELHDNVNQILVGSLLNLSRVKDLHKNAEKAFEFIDTTKGHIGDAIQEIRKLSHQLAPATFDDNSLKDIFEKLLFDINLDNLFTINLHFDELNQKNIPDDIQINLYRILQEQTKNILKYAEASIIETAVTLSGNIISLRIFDNGKGFNTMTSKNGIGLGNIKKRAESLSGKFILNSAPGKGCEIIVEIPLNK